MLQKYPAISLWKRVKKIFEEHVFFSNITINHKLILSILRKDCPKCNLKRAQQPIRRFRLQYPLVFYKVFPLPPIYTELQDFASQEYQNSTQASVLIILSPTAFYRLWKTFFHPGFTNETHICIIIFHSLPFVFNALLLLALREQNTSRYFLRLLKQQERFVS